MKPIQKTASKIIRVDGMFLIAKVGGSTECIGSREIMEAFGGVPPRDYKVTYTLRKTGKYLVERGTTYMGLKAPGVHAGGLAICWFPRRWVGEKVSRRVKILPKRRDK
jgi:hypothetical protein